VLAVAFNQRAQGGVAFVARHNQRVAHKPAPLRAFECAAAKPLQSLTFSTLKNASWGTSTAPTCFMRFLPSFWRSSSLRLRVMSPP